MRVGRISTRIFPDRGGPANHVYYISLALEKIGVKNTIVSSAPQSKNTPSSTTLLRALPFPSPQTGASKLMLAIFSISFFVVGLFWSLVVFLQNRVTIIHAHSPSLSGFLGLAVSKILRKPLIFSIHGMLGPKFNWSTSSGNSLHFIIEKLVINNSQAIIVVTSNYTRFIKNMVPKSLITVIGNGVDTSRFHPLKNSRVRKNLRVGLDISDDVLGLLWVGSFNIDEKVAGLIDLIGAMRLVLDQGRMKWILFLAGDGYRTNEIRKLVDDMGLSDYVRFLKHRKDIPQLMQALDIFLLVSHHEGSPNALLEAMASGLPCIVSRVGGIPQIVGSNVAIVDPSDIVGLSRLVTKIISNAKLREEMSESNRNRVCSMMSWLSVAKKTRILYTRIAMD